MTTMATKVNHKVKLHIIHEYWDGSRWIIRLSNNEEVCSRELMGGRDLAQRLIDGKVDYHNHRIASR